MTRKITTIAAAAVAATLSTAAIAQDADQWQGFYGGLKFSAHDHDTTPGALPLDQAYNAGIFAGYNHAIAPNMVIGGELGYDGKARAEIAPGLDLEVDKTVTLRGRAGYAIGNSMIYGSLGYAWSDYGFSAGGTTGSADGVTYGAGIETLVTDNITARFEYTRSSRDLSGGPLAGQDMDINSFSVGVAYKF